MDDLQRWKRSETPPRAKAQADLAIIIIVQFHALKVYVSEERRNILHAVPEYYFHNEQRCNHELKKKNFQYNIYLS